MAIKMKKTWHTVSLLIIKKNERRKNSLAHTETKMILSLSKKYKNLNPRTLEKHAFNNQRKLLDYSLFSIGLICGSAMHKRHALTR